MNKLISLATLLLCASFTAPCNGQNTKTTEELNAQALAEYQIPIRPGTEGRNPFWNEYAKKFTYAPAFDFKEVKGARSYRFTVIWEDDVWRNPVHQRPDKPDFEVGDEEDVPTMEDGSSRDIADARGRDLPTFTFTAASPKADLSPIWQQIPVGNVQLVVEGIDGKGKVVGISGQREFMRDFPFLLPQLEAVRPYKEAAIMAALYLHRMPAVQSWRTSTEPDFSYKHNTYPSKIIGATIRMECIIAKIDSAKRDEALTVAKNAAQFLISQSRKAGEPLAYFTPTYYGDYIASAKKENKGKTLGMEASVAAQAFLDLYDITGEKAYFDRCIGIAETYRRIQREDGSIPMKMDFATGVADNTQGALLGPLMKFLVRLENQYGVKDFISVREKGEKWMDLVAVETFDMTGQFEDVTVNGWKPYQNLTNCTAAPYASFLLKKANPSERDIQNALDLIRLSEDQFTHWDALLNADGFRPIACPGVYEQYQYRVPIDNSACNVANALLDWYEYDGNELALAKAKTLIDYLTIVQNPVNGQILTTWDLRSWEGDAKRAFWINCSTASIEALLRLDAILAKKR